MDRSSSLTKGVNIHFKHTCDHLWPGLRLSLVKELIKERKILEGSKGDRLFCSKIIHHRGPWSSTQSQSSNSPSGLFKLQAVFFSANYPPLSWPAPSWAVSTTVSRYITAITYHSGSDPRPKHKGGGGLSLTHRPTGSVCVIWQSSQSMWRKQIGTHWVSLHYFYNAEHITNNSIQACLFYSFWSFFSGI